MANVIISTNSKSHIAFRLEYLHLTLPYSIGQGHVWAHFISGMVNFTIPLDMKSYMGFRLAYLDLTSSYSKGQDQGHAYVDCECLENGERLDNH